MKKLQSKKTIKLWVVTDGISFLAPLGKNCRHGDDCDFYWSNKVLADSLAGGVNMRKLHNKNVKAVPVFFKIANEK